MRRKAVLVAFGALACMVCAACGRPPGQPLPYSEVIAPDQVTDFNILFAENCAGCHGPGGKGGAATSLSNPVFLAIADDTAIRAPATNGVPGTPMPAFAQSAGGMLTDKQIEVIVRGIRSWARPDFLRGVALPPYSAQTPGDPHHGAEVYTTYCLACHGADGLGQRAQNGLGYQFPPLWGPDNYNNGAGMSRLLTAAAYALHNMPLGTRFDVPVLTDEQAYDVAGYIVSHDRPKKENLDEDFPIRLQKPIDTPYGPYADGFSAQQHTLGPFGPIRARVKELAAESGTVNAGEPDNGSHEAGAAR